VLPATEEPVNRQSNVLRDLSQQNRREVAAAVNWDGCAPTIGMSKLFMGSALAHFYESKAFKDHNDLSRFKYRNVAHA